MPTGPSQPPNQWLYQTVDPEAADGGWGGCRWPQLPPSAGNSPAGAGGGCTPSLATVTERRKPHKGRALRHRYHPSRPVAGGGPHPAPPAPPLTAANSPPRPWQSTTGCCWLAETVPPSRPHSHAAQHPQQQGAVGAVAPAPAPFSFSYHTEHGGYRTTTAWGEPLRQRNPKPWPDTEEYVGKTPVTPSQHRVAELWGRGVKGRESAPCEDLGMPGWPRRGFFPFLGGEGNFPPHLMLHVRQNLHFQSLLRIRKI